ncbi:MAG TPA: hypothetical protein VMK65_10810, partial [Longimicrobiales bacterium]|nr:hypothetical protein [Longimicrobiales bacterium]
MNASSGRAAAAPGAPAPRAVRAASPARPGTGAPSSRLGAVALALALALPGSAFAQEPPADTARDTARAATKKPLPLVPARALTMEATEGSWLSLDVSPDGRTLVFDLLGDLYTVPLEGGAATRVTSGMGYDVQPRFSPDGRQLVFVSDRSGADNVWTLDLATGDTTQISKNTTTEDFISPEWTPDGSYIVVSKGRGNLDLWLYHVRGGTGTALVSEPEGHKVGAAFGADERYVWYATRGRRHEYNAELPTYELAVYDRDSGRSTRMTSRWGSALRPGLSPDGRWLTYGTRHEGETGLRLRDLETGEERWLAYPIQRDDQESVAALDALPGYSFTPDSREVVLSYGGRIWRVAVDGGGEREVPFRAPVHVDIGPEVRFDFEVPASPTFAVRQLRDAVPSPDGRRLAFTALNRLYVMDWPDGTPRQIAPMEPGQHTPAWSPDGRWISFVTWEDAQGGHIWKVRPDGSQAQRLTQDAAYFRGSVWSPDGARIVSIKGAPRDVQEARGGFGGGLATELVWVPQNGGAANRIALTEGRRDPHFTRDPERVWAYHPQRGLVSFRWDGTDERAHVIVTGKATPGSERPPRAGTIRMAPEGDVALAQVGLDLYTVTVPLVGGETPEVSVANPERAAFPVRKLTEVGGQFPAWSADARHVHWSIGNAHFVYDLERARAVEDSIRGAERDRPEPEEPVEDEPAPADTLAGEVLGVPA